MYAILFLLGSGLLVIPIVAIAMAVRASQRAARAQDQLELLERAVERARIRLDLLERGAAPPSPDLAAARPHAAASVSEAPAVSAPLAEVAAIAPHGLEQPAAPFAPDLSPVSIPAPTAGSAAAEAEPEAAPARRRLDSSRLEQLIGGIWLQNVGSVLLLLGTFFLILWGYTKGKIGPAILVLAGVAFGFAVAWRGDRLARAIRPLGHALLGVGLGVVYIAIYLGHFRMNVLPGWAAFALLAMLSFFTVDAGLRRAQAVIAALGVAGAFVPLLMAALPGLGFHLAPPALLGYFAVVNAVVFALTAARGWTGLLLMALLFTSVAWATNMQGSAWGVSVQIGLSALYTALGMAPVLRLARSPGPVRGVDLGVVASAPILLLVGSYPYLAATKGVTTGGILAGLGLVNLAAALWVDARRSERDLWRPLTGAATVFLTAALERFLANEYLALAWCVEGAVLVWLGLAPRGAWLRLMGYAVSAFALLRLLIFPGDYDPRAGGGIGIFNGTALRDLLCIAAFLVVSDRIGRRRETLSNRERHAPGGWLLATTAIIMIWFHREAAYLARWIAWWATPLPASHPGSLPVEPPEPRVPWMSVLALAWTAHAGALTLLARVRRAALLRHVGYVVGGLAFLVLIQALEEQGLWQSGLSPIFYPAGLLTLSCVALEMGIAWFLWSGRTALSGRERWSPHVAIGLANLALLGWVGREAAHVAHGLIPGAKAAPVSGLAWAVQSSLLIHLASLRNAPILRHTGYGVGGIAAFGIFLAVTDGGLWKPGYAPVLYPAGLFTALSVVTLLTATSHLWSLRPHLPAGERYTPEIAAIVVNSAILLWTGREAGHLASALSPGASLTPAAGDAASMLAAVILSAGWMAQAGALFALGWVRRSPFFRWMGLGLVGLTLLKFVLFDLQRVDVFWRFVVALGVGAVLLLVSFLYQRGARRERSEGDVRQRRPGAPA